MAELSRTAFAACLSFIYQSLCAGVWPRANRNSLFATLPRLIWIGRKQAGTTLPGQVWLREATWPWMATGQYLPAAVCANCRGCNMLHSWPNADLRRHRRFWPSCGMWKGRSGFV